MFNELTINSNNINDNNESITKEYNLILRPNYEYKKRIRYNNPDDFNKKYKISSRDPLLKLSTEEMIIEYKTSKYIKFTITTPMTIGTYKSYINIESNNQLEEILKFNIEIKAEN